MACPCTLITCSCKLIACPLQKIVCPCELITCPYKLIAMDEENTAVACKNIGVYRGITSIYAKNFKPPLCLPKLNVV